MSSRLRALAPAAFAIVLTSAAALSSTGLVTAARKGATGPRGADQIEIARLRADLTFIASDELEGRDTPSRGLDIAARYIAEHLANWGVKPAGDNGPYFQKVPLTL